MNNTIRILLSLLLSSHAVTLLAEPSKKVAIIVPAPIQALIEITQGFESSLKEHYHGPIDFKIANTQGDPMLQYATIQSLRQQHYDLIVPIGSDATAATLSLIKTIPVLSLASDLSEMERQKRQPCNVAVVHDEISPKEQLNYLHQVLPNIKQVSLIHSAADKIFSEVEEAKKAGKEFGITITPMMAASLMDLQLVATKIPADAQAIFILKDMQTVSGMAQLHNIAASRQLHLISSDDGSVKDGAEFALGVEEKEIGIRGGMLAAEILQGKDPGTLPIAEMTKLTLFFNPTAVKIKKSGTFLETLKAVAVKMHYQVQEVSNQKKGV